MKTDKLFRFTMQIPATTPENCKVGDFLESLKNKKARFIVSVVSEYLDAHPELLNHASIVVRTQPSITEAAVLAMIERALAQQPRTSHETVPMDSKEDLGGCWRGYVSSVCPPPAAAAPLFHCISSVFCAIYLLCFLWYCTYIEHIQTFFSFSWYEGLHVQEIFLTGFLCNVFPYPFHPKNIFVGAPCLVRPFLFVRG